MVLVSSGQSKVNGGLELSSLKVGYAQLVTYVYVHMLE